MPLEAAATSLSLVLRDYRRHEAVRITPDSVLRWAYQFDADIRLALLTGLTSILTAHFYDVNRCRNLLRQMLHSTAFTGGNPALYWSTTSLVDEQQRGSSQRLLVRLLRELAREEFGQGFRFGGVEAARSFYVDDFLFSGQRMKEDFTRWISGGRWSNQSRHLDIGMFGAHSLGLYYFERHAASEIAAVDRRATYKIKFASRYENRLSHKDFSDVYWPSIPASSLGYPQFDGGRLALRTVAEPVSAQQTSRLLLEKELLRAGCKIAADCMNRTSSLRPMGYYNLGHGFGAVCATYLNCPNNAPLALWWSVNGWSPLMPRRIND